MMHHRRILPSVLVLLAILMAVSATAVKKPKQKSLQPTVLKDVEKAMGKSKSDAVVPSTFKGVDVAKKGIDMLIKGVEAGNKKDMTAALTEMEPLRSAERLKIEKGNLCSEDNFAVDSGVKTLVLKLMESLKKREHGLYTLDKFDTPSMQDLKMKTIALPLLFKDALADGSLSRQECLALQAGIRGLRTSMAAEVGMLEGTQGATSKDNSSETSSLLEVGSSVSATGTATLAARARAKGWVLNVNTGIHVWTPTLYERAYYAIYARPVQPGNVAKYEQLWTVLSHRQPGACMDNNEPNDAATWTLENEPRPSCAQNSNWYCWQSYRALPAGNDCTAGNVIEAGAYPVGFGNTHQKTDICFMSQLAGANPVPMWLSRYNMLLNRPDFVAAKIPVAVAQQNRLGNNRKRPTDDAEFGGGGGWFSPPLSQMPNPPLEEWRSAQTYAACTAGINQPAGGVGAVPAGGVPVFHTTAQALFTQIFADLPAPITNPQRTGFGRVQTYSLANVNEAMAHLCDQVGFRDTAAAAFLFEILEMWTTARAAAGAVVNPIAPRLPLLAANNVLDAPRALLVLRLFYGANAGIAAAATPALQRTAIQNYFADAVFAPVRAATHYTGSAMRGHMLAWTFFANAGGETLQSWATFNTASFTPNHGPFDARIWGTVCETPLRNELRAGANGGDTYVWVGTYGNAAVANAGGQAYTLPEWMFMVSKFMITAAPNPYAVCVAYQAPAENGCRATRAQAANQAAMIAAIPANAAAVAPVVGAAVPVPGPLIAEITRVLNTNFT